MSIVFAHFCLPGAVASIACLPGSTGIGVPNAAESTTVPSRVTRAD
jgi:hypothetical protein